MAYKSLKQLQKESKAHSDTALRLFREAAEIHKKLKEAISILEFVELQEQWLEKHSQARTEIQKSIALKEQFIQELERLKKRNLN